MPTIEEFQARLDRIESQLYGTGFRSEFGDLPNSNIFPEKLEASATPGVDGTFVLITWAQYDHTIEGYEVWAKGPDGRQALQTTVRTSPAFFTLSVESSEAWTFTVRPKKGDQTPALDFCPTVSATIEAPEVNSADIAAGAVQNQHFDRVSANRISIVDADIVSLTANKINTGTLSAIIINAVTIGTTGLTAGSGTTFTGISSAGLEVNAGSPTRRLRVQSGSITLDNGSGGGTTYVQINASTISGGGGGSWLDSGTFIRVGSDLSTTELELLGQAKGAARRAIIRIGGNMVVGPRLAAVATVVGGAGATYTATEQGIIDNLVTAVNLLIARLDSTTGHGLIT